MQVVFFANQKRKATNRLTFKINRTHSDKRHKKSLKLSRSFNYTLYLIRAPCKLIQSTTNTPENTTMHIVTWPQSLYNITIIICTSH